MKKDYKVIACRVEREIYDWIKANNKSASAFLRGLAILAYNAYKAGGDNEAKPE